MRFSQLFGKTLREAPAEATLVSQQLAIRSALIRRGDGATVYLPLGFRVQQKLRDIVREELTTLGGLEMRLGRQASIALYKGDLVSHRDLPRLVFDATGEIIRAQTFCPNEETSQNDFRQAYHALLRVLVRCGVKVSSVEAGRGAYVFVGAHEKGEDELLICESLNCGYASTAEWAEFKTPAGVKEESKSLTKVETPHCPTIAALAEYLKIETRQTIKAVMYTREARDESEFVFVVLRGDLDVSLPKLAAALGGPLTGSGHTLRPATEAEIEAAGAVPGYASPAGLKVAAAKDRARGLITVVADPSIQVGANFAAGANEAGYHFVNVNYPRDFTATIVAEVALASAGATCARCGEHELKSHTAFGVGVCRNLGESVLTFLGEEGRPKPVWMADCRLDVERLLLMIIEQHHDENGIVWPESVAPFDAHLVRLGKAPETFAAADKLWVNMEAAGKSVLYDDRDESAGVKFADADLIGAPLRVTVSDKSLKAGGAEVKRRNSAEKTVVALDAVIKFIRPLPR
ncbi:MAG TPA: YbaK/EbsC family protein [Anaerolineales bacterium]|nr:YbaK/EbsC family protein [Anaerolineales bacterium]